MKKGTATVSGRLELRTSVRVLLYLGIVIVGMVLAWVVMPYSENACPLIADSECTIPSQRQRVWLTAGASLVVLIALAIELRSRPSVARSVHTYAVPLLAIAIPIALFFLPNSPYTSPV